MKAKQIVIIGAGRLATSLAPALARAAHVVQVCSRTRGHAAALASRCGDHCTATDDLTAIVPDADFYIIAVNDDAIAGVVAAAPEHGGVWLHTSGTCPMDVFRGKRRRYGTFYPLMSFTTEPVAMDGVPLFVDGCDDDTRREVAALAATVSSDVRHLEPRQMPMLHLAGVIANNFSNHLLDLADGILNDIGLDVGVMMPMMEAMLRRVKAGQSPRDIQSGPARRGDLGTVNRHRAMLAGNRQLLDVYNLLTQGIAERYGNTL